MQNNVPDLNVKNATRKVNLNALLLTTATTSREEIIGVYAGIATANELRLVPDFISPLVAEEADDDEVMALFDELEPYYSRTNQMLAKL